MPKYPQVERLFIDLFGDENGNIAAETRHRIMETTGATAATVSRWVNGEAKPKATIWKLIAQAANVDRGVVAAALAAPAIDLTALVTAVEANSTKLDALAERVGKLHNQTYTLLDMVTVMTELLAEGAAAWSAQDDPPDEPMSVAGGA